MSAFRKEDSPYAARLIPLADQEDEVQLDGDEIAVYERYSRLNHSCVPNALAVTDGGYRAVFAQAEIRAGEEVSVAYMEDIDVGDVAAILEDGITAAALSAALTQQQLFGKWRFFPTNLMTKLIVAMKYSLENT